MLLLLLPSPLLATPRFFSWSKHLQLHHSLPELKSCSSRSVSLDLHFFPVLRNVIQEPLLFFESLSLNLSAPYNPKPHCSTFIWFYGDAKSSFLGLVFKNLIHGPFLCSSSVFCNVPFPYNPCHTFNCIENKSTARQGWFLSLFIDFLIFSVRNSFTDFGSALHRFYWIFFVLESRILSFSAHELASLTKNPAHHWLILSLFIFFSFPLKLDSWIFATSMR